MKLKKTQIQNWDDCRSANKASHRNMCAFRCETQNKHVSKWMGDVNKNVGRGDHVYVKVTVKERAIVDVQVNVGMWDVCYMAEAEDEDGIVDKTVRACIHVHLNVSVNADDDADDDAAADADDDAAADAM